MEASETESSIPLRFSPLEDESSGFFCFGDVRQIRNSRKRKKKKEKRFRGIWFSVIPLAPFFLLDQEKGLVRRRAGFLTRPSKLVHTCQSTTAEIDTFYERERDMCLVNDSCLF